jgi:hypothetical protein
MNPVQNCSFVWMNSSESNKSVLIHLILPLATLACFAGCSTLDGTTGQSAPKSRVSTYAPAQRPVNPDEAGEGPGYEWWY